MVAIPFKLTCKTLLAVTVLVFMWAPPLWAGADPSTTPSQEESVFQTLKRKTRELFKSNPTAKEVQKETPQPVEKEPQEESSTQKSDGRKAIDTVKKEMNKISDNVSESVERDKKTLKNKLDKLLDKK